MRIAWVFLLLSGAIWSKAQSSTEEIISSADEFAWNVMQKSNKNFLLNSGSIANNEISINIYKCTIDNLSCSSYMQFKNGEDYTFQRFNDETTISSKIIDSNKVRISIWDQSFSLNKQMDLNLDSLKIKILSEIKITDYGIYIMGYVSKPESPWDILLIKVNHELTDYKYFSPNIEGMSELIFDVIESKEGIFISTKSINTDKEDFNGNELIRIDTALNRITNIWDKEIDSEGHMELLWGTGGQIICTGRLYYSVNFDSYFILSSGLMSIEDDSLIMESKIEVGKDNISYQEGYYGSVLIGDYLYIVGTGSFNPQNPFFQNADNEILLSKIKVGNDTLEEVWTKYYDFPGHYLYATGISAISDSSLLIHGSTYGYSDHPENLRNPFLMKVDLDGNLANYTTVEFPEVSSIGVYPNPTSNLLHFEIPAKEQSYRVKIIDLQGNMVLRKELPESGNLYVGELATGVYLYKIVDPEGKVISGKFLKE